MKILGKGLSSSIPEMKKRSRHWGDKGERTEGSRRERWLKVCRTLVMKSWVEEALNEERMPQYSRHAAGFCAWELNDQEGLEMSAGPPESWFVCGENSFDMVGRVYWPLAGLSESSTAAFSPYHSIFGADRPN